MLAWHRATQFCSEATAAADTALPERTEPPHNNRAKLVKPKWVKPKWAKPKWVEPKWVRPKWVKPKWVDDPRQPTK
jgi:hypothetical protein